MAQKTVILEPKISNRSHVEACKNAPRQQKAEMAEKPPAEEKVSEGAECKGSFSKARDGNVPMFKQESIRNVPVLKAEWAEMTFISECFSSFRIELGLTICRIRVPSL